MSKRQTIVPPWRQVIVIKPGCEEEIRKAGENARRIEGDIKQEIILNPELKHCHEYPVKQEREH